MRSGSYAPRGGGIVVEEKYLSDDALAEIEKRRKQMEEMRMKEKKRQTELLEIQSIQGKIDASSADSVFSEMSQHKPEDLIEKHVRTGNGLRVVLDAANIGWGYGGYHSHSSFDVRGVTLAHEFFLQQGFHVIAFLPRAFHSKRQSATHSRSNAVMETDDWSTLDNMVSSGKITLVPPGDDDDSFILTYARENLAFVVSNDFFADHVRKLKEVNEGVASAMQSWVSANRAGYLFSTEQCGAGTSSRVGFHLLPSSALGAAIARIREAAGGHGSARAEAGYVREQIQAHEQAVWALRQRLVWLEGQGGGERQEQGLGEGEGDTVDMAFMGDA